jgi:hypothetical protein
MSEHKNPKWWNSKNDFAWNRARMVMRKLNQIKADHAKPYKDMEPAYRFGFGARLTFGDRDWDANFEIRLAEDWRAMTPSRKQKWEHDRNAILDGWNLGAKISSAQRRENKLLQDIEPGSFAAHQIADRLAA